MLRVNLFQMNCDDQTKKFQHILNIRWNIDSFSSNIKYFANFWKLRSNFANLELQTIFYHVVD